MDHNFETLDDAGITQGEFAELLGVQRASVNNWVNGRSKPHTLHREKVRKMLLLIQHAIKLRLLPADMPSVYKGRMAARRDFIRARLAEAAELLPVKRTSTTRSRKQR